MRTPVSGTFLCLTVAAPLLLAASGPAWAHADLRSAAPAEGGTLTVAPTEVSLAFSESLEPRFSSIEITDAAGQRVDAGNAHTVGDAQHFAVGLKTLAPGTYTVRWQATSVDTHKTSGTYQFTLLATESTGITVQQAWVRPSIGASGTSALYFTLVDAGNPDRLVGVSTPVAASADLHESISENGIMKMRGVAGVAIERDKPLRFAPGGYHVMLMGLKQPLKAGETIPVTLQFQKAPPLAITVPVQTAPTAAAHGHEMGSMGSMPAGAKPGVKP
ncbi:MAG: copper chaperone PCu(A)C [Rhodospirillales bacterium]|nr:copper chaperone PCu(A)C [Rhodospirillales bacterium]MBN8897861.1 copper chaperone PCu(A)C [Rhodospirillales bacterium]